MPKILLIIHGCRIPPLRTQAYNGPPSSTLQIHVSDLYLEVMFVVGDRDPGDVEAGQPPVPAVHEHVVHHGEPLDPRLGLLVRRQRGLSVQRHVATALPAPRVSISVSITVSISVAFPLSLAAASFTATVPTGEINKGGRWEESLKISR